MTTKAGVVKKGRIKSDVEESSCESNYNIIDSQLIFIWENTKEYFCSISSEDIEMVQNLHDNAKLIDSSNETLYSQYATSISRCPSPSFMLSRLQLGVDSNMSQVFPAVQELLSQQGAVDEYFASKFGHCALCELQSYFSGDNKRLKLHHRDDIISNFIDVVEKYENETMKSSPPRSQSPSNASVPSNKILHPKRSYFLGKRKRFYGDIENEQNFLERSRRDCDLPVISDWSELLKYYDDDHDGSYQRFMIAMSYYQKNQTELLRNKKNIGSRHHLGLNNPTMISPPVPVSLQHPASWGISSRVSMDSFCDKNSIMTSKNVFEHIHPASLSKSIVMPPGLQTSSYCYENLDDITVFTEMCESELYRIEKNNLELYDKLLKTSKLSSMRNVLNQERIQLSQLLEKVFVVDELKMASIEWYPFIPLEKGVDSITDIVANVKDDTLSAAMKPVLGYPQTSSSMPVNFKKNTDVMLGACPARNIRFGDSLLAMKVGDIVEYLLDGMWILVVIKKFRYDCSLLRFIKVQSYKSSALDIWWVAVEDNMLAPLGTHLGSETCRLISSPSVIVDNSSSCESLDDKGLETTTRDLNVLSQKKDPSSENTVISSQLTVSTASCETKPPLPPPPPPPSYRIRRGGVVVNSNTNK